VVVSVASDLFAEAMIDIMTELEIVGLGDVPVWLRDAIVVQARERVTLWNIAQGIVADAAARLSDEVRG
jgi:hypothetical protein